ncbi:MAG TPA: 3-keto-5-aminohexanoate cleavage protein [Candidatus Aminicenantes bacterium]|nr:3-keto-5-aminohexanoate cleavage protein [Candidatus Aminicenantes bacterium]
MMVNKVIINCAVTGAIHVPSMTPYLPITPEQIASDAIKAAEAGAATVHLHARNPKNGEPTMDLELFQTFCQEVHRKSDVVICITTGGAPTMTPEERMVAVKKFKPELASLNMGSMNIGLFPQKERIKEYQWDWEEAYLDRSKDNVFKNTFHDQERILSICRKNETKPEMECYDVGHIYSTAYWVDKGVIEPPFWLQFIFGLLGGIGSSVDNLVLMKNTADKLFGKDYVFSVLAAGRNEFSLGTVGTIMGGSVRVGLEDNLYLGKGELAKNNAEMVCKMVRILNELSIEHASPQEARKILKLKGKENTSF